MIATTLKEINPRKLNPIISREPYLRAFSDKLKKLHTRLSQTDDTNPFDTALDIKEDYLPAIQEFIFTIDK